METLTQDGPKRSLRTLKVDEIPDSLLHALKVKAAQDRLTVRAAVIMALQNFTGMVEPHA